MARKTPGIYIAIRGDYSAFNTDMLKVKQLAKAQAEDIAKSINNAVSAADLSSGIYKITRELKTAQAALSAGAFKGQVSGLEEIAKAAGVSSKQLEGLTNSMLKSQAAATANRAFEYLQKNAGLSTLELAKLRVQLGDTSGAMSTLWSGAKAAAVPVMAIGAAAIYAGKACFDASLQMDRLVKSYTTIEGSTSGAVSQLDYIYEISNKLGLEFQSTAEAAKGFFAAGKGSALQKDLNGIFEGVSQAGAALSLSTEQMDGVFLALGQMISKGKVQAEELRGQLGERLPGAFNLAARAMGVTTAQLDDMLKKGQVTAEDMLPKLAAVLKDEFGPAAEQASQGAQGAVNRLSTEWNLFKATVMDNKGIIAAINAITGALENRNQAMMKAARREAAIKSLEEDGVIKQGEKEVTDVSIASGAVTVQKIKFYTEEQIKARMGLEKAWEAHNKHSKQLQEEETKIIADGSAATKNFLKNSTEGKKAALQEDYNNTLKALNAQIAVYKKQGQDVSGLEQERLKITAEYQRQLESINKKGTKSAETAAKRAAVSGINLDELRKSVEALEAANIPAAKSFDQMAEKIREQSKQTQIAIEADAARMVATKKLTVAQAEEWKGLKFREDAAKTTQKLAEVEAKRAEQDKKYADLRLDFEKRYADMVGLSSEAVSKSISKQAEEYRKAIEAGENAAEELVRLEEWKRDQIQRASREAMDGAQVALRDYQVEASNQAKSMNDAFRGLFSGMDSGWKSAWEQMIETGKVSLSSFRSVFASFLADLMHMAITRPITVQIAGVVSGMLGTDGVAYASGGSGGVGGMSNLSGLSNLMPGSWTSGIADTINNTMAGWFPGTFAMSGAAGTVMTPVVGAADIAGLKAAEAAMLGGNAGGGMAASGGTFLSTVSPYLMAGGLGSLGYTMLGGALGLPQSKYSGLTAGLGGAAGWGLGSLAAGSFASIGATMGSVVPVVGTIIGALAGGALGSLFGQERKTHPSVYGHMMDQGYTTDTQTYIDAFMNQATYDRAGKTEASAYAQVIGEAASQTAGNILNLAAMLPDEYKKNVEDQLESATWSAGRGYSGASWNLQNWKEGMAEERIQEAVDDMFEQMGYGANKAFAEAGIGDLFDSFDLSTEEGFKKAQTAISAISSITTAIDEIKSPTSEAEQQAKAFVAQMDALGEAVKASGLNAAYADEMLSDYRTAYVDNYVNSLEEMFNPLSQIEQQAKGYKEAIDGYVAALTTMGASEAQLAQVRGYTQDAIDNITGSLDAAFFPLSSVEQQTKSTMESLLAYKAALETLGASAEELTRIDAAWGKMQADLLDKARAYVSTTPEVVSQAATMNAEFDALRKAMELAGNATADLTELEQTRAQAVAALQAQYAESFRQTYAQRYATLTGDTNGLANLQQQASFASELAETEKTWGKDSEQYRQMQALQDAEAAKQRLEQAQAAYAALQAQLEKQQAELKQLEQQAVQLQIEEIQKLQTASKERIAALEKELSAAQKLHDTWEDVFATAYAKRVDLYQGNTNLDVFGRLDTAQGEFDRLYGLAIGGDADAAKEMAGVASELLGLRGETTANRDDYLNAFYDVDKKLKEVSAYADAQVSDAQKQIDTLQAQLEAENAQYSILVSQLSAQQAALSALNGQTQTLASIQAQIAKLKTEINITIDGKNVASSTVGNAQGDYDDAKDHVDQTKPVVGIYGSKYLTEYDLLVAKVASLNRGEFVNADADTRDWTVAKARQAMIGEYGSVKNWYLQIGKPVEGFERGGLATPGGPKMFGERGIEYGDVEQPTRIYDATKTRLMLEGGHEYAREAYKGMAEFSRMLARTSGARGDGNKEETAALRKEVRELRGMLKAMLTSVVKNTKDVRDFLEEFEETGLPPQRVNA